MTDLDEILDNLYSVFSLLLSLKQAYKTYASLKEKVDKATAGIRDRLFQLKQIPDLENSISSWLN